MLRADKKGRLGMDGRQVGFWTVGLLRIPKKCEGGAKGDAKEDAKEDAKGANGDAKERRLRRRLGDDRPSSHTLSNPSYQPLLHLPSQPLHPPLHLLRIFWECEVSPKACQVNGGRDQCGLHKI